MIHQMRKTAWVWTVVLVAHGAASLEARPWKKAMAAAMALVLLGGGPAAQVAMGGPEPDGALGLQPFPGFAGHGPEPDLGHLAAGLEPAGVDDPAPDCAEATLGTCEDACGHRFNLAMIRCEAYQRMPALRTLCITQALAADEACMRGCEGR